MTPAQGGSVSCRARMAKPTRNAVPNQPLPETHADSDKMRSHLLSWLWVVAVACQGERLTMAKVVVIAFTQDSGLLRSFKAAVERIPGLCLEHAAAVSTAHARLFQPGVALVLVHVPSRSDTASLADLMRRAHERRRRVEI